MTLLDELTPSGLNEDSPRPLDGTLTPGDKAFRGIARAVGFSVLIITGSIGLFLAYQALPTLHHYGLSFFTHSEWNPDRKYVGIAAVLLGTLTVALVALTFAFPLALGTALYISEYAPVRMRPILISIVDLMAAIPSIIYGLWGFFLVQPEAKYIARWLSEYMAWVPFFHVNSVSNAAAWDQSEYVASAFIAGIAVSMMVIPMGCSVMREVFSHAPLGEREGALALGSTRWGVIRSVVLPFGKAGIIGGTMLSLGRALGETIAVVIIISPDFTIKFHPLERGTETVSALIAGLYSASTPQQLSALLTAGFVLFVITLIVNTIAATIVNRSRGGGATEL